MDEFSSRDMFCSRCGVNLGPGSTFCSKCGELVKPETGPSESRASVQRSVTRQPMMRRTTGRHIPTSAISSMLSGIIALVMVALPFATIDRAYRDLAYSSGATSLVVAQGDPLVWLIVGGGALAAILGIVGIISSRTEGDAMLNPSAADMMVLAGALALIGSILGGIIGLYQLRWGIARELAFGPPGALISMYPGIGIFGSIIMGGMILIQGIWMRGD